MKLVKTSLVVILTIILASCATVTKEPSAILKNNGEPWFLRGIVVDGQFSKTFKKPERVTIVFRKNGIVAGRRLVNSYFGQVEFIGENGIKFGERFGQTMRNGSKVSMARDKYYLELLISTEKYFLKKNQLFLTSEEGDIVLIYTKSVKTN